MSCRRCVAALGLRQKPAAAELNVALLRERCAASRRTVRRSRAARRGTCAGQDQPGVAQEGCERRLFAHLQHGVGLVRTALRPCRARRTARTRCCAPCRDAHACRARSQLPRGADAAAGGAPPLTRPAAASCPWQRNQREAVWRAARHAVPRQEQLHRRRHQASCQRGCAHRCGSAQLRPAVERTASLATRRRHLRGEDCRLHQGQKEADLQVLHPVCRGGRRQRRLRCAEAGALRRALRRRTPATSPAPLAPLRLHAV